MHKKRNRVLEIFYQALNGEYLSIKELSDKYQVSAKSISRDIGEIKNFLSDNRELVGNTEMKYEASTKRHYLEVDGFLLNKELISVIKILIGSRGLSKVELLSIISKMKMFTTCHDREMLERLISKEVFHYNEVHHDCGSVIDYIWKLTRCINERREITVSYYKMERELVERRIKPVSIMFSEYYYYLIAYRCDTDDWKTAYFRIDRIVNIVEHRCRFELDAEHDFDEGELRNKIQFMFPGKYRRIKFEFSGPSVQAILDRIPTARIVDVQGKKKTIEAETYGTGINMYLLSQGSWVKALEPPEFVAEMKEEIQRMNGLYE